MNIELLVQMFYLISDPQNKPDSSVKSQKSMQTMVYCNHTLTIRILKCYQCQHSGKKINPGH